MQLANPYFLLLLLLLIPYILWYVLRHRTSEPALQVSSTAAFRRAPKTFRQYLIHAPFLLRCLAFLMIVLVLCRPQTSNSWSDKTIEGIDIMLCMDISTSMLAEDLTPNRIEAAKKVAAEFIAGRPNDNIGLTIFSGESFTQCPMTTDHAVLLNLFQSVSCDMVQRGLMDDGTAIGMGLANSITRLKDSKAKSKVIILLTDGSNNAGDISPLTADHAALLHVLKGTRMGEEYLKEPFPVFTLEEYTDLIVDCLKLIPEHMVVHRMTGDAPKRLLIAPAWSADKKRVLNTLKKKSQVLTSF